MSQSANPWGQYWPSGIGIHTYRRMPSMVLRTYSSSTPTGSGKPGLMSHPAPVNSNVLPDRGWDEAIARLVLQACVPYILERTNTSQRYSYTTKEELYRKKGEWRDKKLMTDNSGNFQGLLVLVSYTYIQNYILHWLNRACMQNVYKILVAKCTL